MNGGTSSPLPARTPITRPVSFHSLPEHQRNSPAHLSPYSHRRPRTPRSSPLTGPSVSSDELNSENKDDEANQKPRYRPNRISSIPDMVVPIQSLYDSDSASLSTPSSAPSTVSLGTIGIVVPVPPIPRPPSSSSSSEDNKQKEEAHDGSKLRRLAKRLSIVSTSSSTANETDKDDEMAKNRRTSFMLHSASSTSIASTSSSRTVRTDTPSQTAPPIPTIPRWALNAMREEAGAANRNMKYGHRRGTSGDSHPSSSLPPLPNQPMPRGIRSSGYSDLPPRPPSISRDPGQNWMSVTDPIPKFSRLGLGGDAVVMPMKKKESLAKMKSAGSIASTRSTATPSQSVGAADENGVRNKTESSPAMDSNDDSNVADKASLKEKEGLRKRRSSLASLKAKMIPKTIVPSSAGNENVPPLPPSTRKSDASSASVTSSHMSLPNDSAPKIVKTSTSPSSMVSFPKFTRKSATIRRDSVLTAIEENQTPSSSTNDVHAEFGGKPRDDTQKRMRRKSIKQIVMRITAAPMSVVEKVKCTTVHDSPSTRAVAVPPDPLTPLEPPPDTRFEKLTSISVSSLPSTKEGSEFGCSRGDSRGNKKFGKSIRKRWNAVFATVRS